MNTSIMSVLVAFLSNLGVPRSGEFLRASSISYYEKIPFEKSFGTIVTERIIDVFILIGLIIYGLTISSIIEIHLISEPLNLTKMQLKPTLLNLKI